MFIDDHDDCDDCDDCDANDDPDDPDDHELLIMDWSILVMITLTVVGFAVYD